MKASLLGYSRSPDGLFRKRITFARPDRPQIVDVKIMVRAPSGKRLRTEHTGNRIRLAQHHETSTAV